MRFNAEPFQRVQRVGYVPRLEEPSCSIDDGLRCERPALVSAHAISNYQQITVSIWRCDDLNAVLLLTASTNI